MEENTNVNNPTEAGAESPETVNDVPENVSEDLENENETPETVSEPKETEQPETTPTGWENASGEEEHPEENETPEVDEQPLPEGQDLSLLLPAFDPIFDTADESLRDMARSMKTKLIESGELNIKITLNNYGAVLVPDPKKCQVTCNLKPAKVSTAIRFPSDLEIAVEQDGRVIIPDGEHQLSFDDVSTGATVTTDASGVVQDVQLDPCCETDCPFYDADEDGNLNCGFKLDGSPDDDLYGDLTEALRQHGCKNPDVLDAYNTLTASAEATEVPEETDSADACENSDCPFFDTECEHNCQGRAEFEQCPGCVKDAVESCHCQNADLLEVYNRLTKEDK
ncbi:hypothetical protein [Caproicibacterium amylolyticum]|uniref:Uncharacterized protein n=1 Tax=Caproicibacterium amylolyticum TaxID=2766537 RepID=A0A7G9WF73_9FIRM|nr:hypothetical protein [Caproicibacterium amylolyticum]QNO17335.1 hypothetical protein H6X83_10320 [Caproicibacterium amylolyticum]